MPQDIELILAKQLASCLSVPVFIVDPEGTLVFYNQPAEAVLGQRFEHTGEMPIEVWSTFFTPMDENGERIPPQELPLAIAVNERRPAHRGMIIRAANGVPRRIEVTGLPLLGVGDRFAGAVALFWEPGKA